MVATSDSENAMRSFLSEGGHSFPVMMDPGDVASRYGVRAIPTVVVIDPEGRIAKKLVGGVSAADLASLVDDLTR